MHKTTTRDRMPKCTRHSVAVVTTLFADLSADGVLLMVQHSLLSFGDVATVLAGHQALFAPDLTIVPVRRCRLRPGEIAFFDFLMNAPILIGQALVDLFTAWMRLLP